MSRCVAALALASALATPAFAQSPRPFPDTALRGELVVTQPPAVLLNGQPARLAPGARIRGENRLIVLSGELVGRTLTVNYTREPLGELFDVWVLTADEASRQPWPETPEQAARWSFDPVAQTWSRR